MATKKTQPKQKKPVIPKPVPQPPPAPATVKPKLLVGGPSFSGKALEGVGATHSSAKPFGA